GQFREALRTYESLGNRTDLGLVPMARLLILQALRRTEAERDWAPVEESLNRAPTGLDRELAWADYLLARGNADKAREALVSAAAKYPKAIEPMAARAVLELRQNQPARALELLAEAETSLGDRVEFRLVRASLAATGATSKAAADLDRLADGL